MTATTALLAVVAVLLVSPGAGGPSRRRRRGGHVHRARPSTALVVRGAAVVAALGVGLLVGGATGWVLGAATGVGVAVVVPRLQTRQAQARAATLARQAPLVVDLVSACLASGASLEASLVASARAVGDPTGAPLLAAAAAMHLGADPATVWRDVAREPALAGLARAVGRSARTGAPLSDLLPRVAAEVRAGERARVEARIRTAAVRLTAPLGAALLPAFVLLGVVPVVASWVGALL